MQVGSGTTENQLPYQVETSGVLQVAVGVSFTAYVKQDGSLCFSVLAQSGILKPISLRLKSGGRRAKGGYRQKSYSLSG